MKKISVNVNFRRLLWLCVFQVIISAICGSADAGGRRMTWDPKIPNMTCYNSSSYPEAKGTVYWKSAIIGSSPYPVVTSDFFLNLLRKSPGSTTVVDSGFDYRSSTASTGSVILTAESWYNVSGTYTALLTIGSDAVMDPNPPYSQNFVVCNK
jgi:hypothetical protein